MSDSLHSWMIKWGIPNVAAQELYTILRPSMPTGSGSTSEAALQAELRVLASSKDAALWRNNSGAMIDQDGRHIRFGLGNDSKKLNKHWKSSDLIGITPVTATAVGQVFGVFTAVECKEPNWSMPRNERDRAQEKFLQTVKSLGGLAGFARSKDDYTRTIYP